MLAEQLRNIGDQYGSRSLAFFTGSGAAGVLTKGSVQRFAAAIGGTAYRAGGVDYGVPKGLEYTFGVPASTYFRPGGHEYRRRDEFATDSALGRQCCRYPAGGFSFCLGGAAARRQDYLHRSQPQRHGAARRSMDFTRPGTDTALALALLNEIIAKICTIASFSRHTNAPFLVRRDNGALLRERTYSSARYGLLVWDSARGEAARRNEVTRRR